MKTRRKLQRKPMLKEPDCQQEPWQRPSEAQRNKQQPGVTGLEPVQGLSRDPVLLTVTSVRASNTAGLAESWPAEYRATKHGHFH